MSKERNKDLVLIKRIFSLAKPYKFTFLFAAVLSITLAPVSILRPYLVQLTVDQSIIGPERDQLMLMISLLVGALVIQGILSYLFSYSTAWLGQSVIRDLRIRVFNHINRLRLTYFDTTPIGTSTTRTINDVETINSVFSQGFITVIADILTLFFVLSIPNIDQKSKQTVGSMFFGNLKK